MLKYFKKKFFSKTETIKKEIITVDTTDTVNKIDTVEKKLKVETKTLEKLDLSKIISIPLPTNQYIREISKKKQIVLHHTVSGQGTNGDISWWRQTTARVGTAIIIDWKGGIYQCFSSKYWAYHLGLKTSNNKKLNKESIGIEIDSWGGLMRRGKFWYPAKWNSDLKKNIPNLKVAPIKSVVTYPDGFRGFYGYEKYTKAQIEALRKLLVYFSEKYNIPLKYNDDMFDLSSKALNGQKGVWSHTSFRKSKSDCHPQPELIKMLKSLT